MVLKRLLALWLIIAATPVLAQIAGGVASDPFILDESEISTSIQKPSRDVNGRALRTQTINTAIQNCVIIAAGQSNSPGAAVATSTFSSVNGTVLDNLNIYDGAIYEATDPLRGGSHLTSPTTNGTPVLRLGDALVTAGKCARVIMLPIAINGTTMDQWGNGSLSDRIPVAVRRITHRGIVCGGTGVICVVLWGHGENDCILGTSQASYVAGFNAMVAKVNAAGFVGRWLVAKQSYNGSVCAAIQNAQTAASPTGVINNGAGIYLGADADALVGNNCNGGNACRDGGGLHWSTNDGVIEYTTGATSGWQKALQNSGAPF